MLSFLENWSDCSKEDCVPDFVDTRKAFLADLAKDISGKTIRVTTTENDPLSYTVETGPGAYVGKGLAFEIVDIMAQKYNFKYTVVKPEENSLDPSANGVFGKLVKGEADMVASFLPVMASFRDRINYSKPLDEGEWVVLMKRPQESATGSGLWAPFTFQVWILILVSLLVVGPVIYGLILLEAKLRKKDECPIYPLPSCVWFVYGALLKQGSTLSPITDSSRLLFATWWIFITILTAFYTANLTAFLTLSKFTLPVGKVEDIGTKKYNWVTHRGSAIEENIKQIDVFRQFFAGSKSEYVDINGTQILADWVDKRNYLYLGEKPIVEYLMYNDYMYNTDPSIKEADRCTFVITQWTVLKTNRAFAYTKTFKYQDLFDDVIQHLVESGIIKYKLREKLPNTAICPLDLGSKERQLYNTDLLMTYVIVGAGFIVSGIVFALELVIHHYKGREMRMKTPKLHNLYEENNNNLFKKRKNNNSEFKFATFTDDNNVKGKLWHEMEEPGAPPPPPYHALFKPPFANSPNGVKKTINGRDYWMVKTVYGETKLIPVRTPSALLFQNRR